MMRHRLTVLGCLLIVGFSVSSQKYIIANNNPAAEPGVNVFIGATAFQDALAAAVDNDVIYVVPSNTPYDVSGTISIDKPLKIYGIGLNPTKDGAKLSTLSNFSLLSGDVLFSGLELPSLVYIGPGISNTTYSNITFENCRISRILQGNGANFVLNNLLIKNNIFSAGTPAIQFYITDNTVVTNNVIFTFANSAIYANTVRFDHNLFIYGGSGLTFGEVDNCFFNYNIFYGTSPNLDVISTGNTFDYNLSFASLDNTFNLLPAYDNSGVGNTIGDPAFTNLVLSNSWVEGSDISLTGGSAAMDIDGSGNDAGPTGGATPWDPEGNNLPLIQSLRIPATVVQGSDLNVEIKGKGN